MTQEIKHTPGPWVIVGKCGHEVLVETTADVEDKQVISSSEWTYCRDADLEFIVRACNSHYELLDALKVLRGAYEGVCKLEDIHPQPELDIADKAIARAEGR